MNIYFSPMYICVLGASYQYLMWKREGTGRWEEKDEGKIEI